MIFALDKKANEVGYRVKFFKTVDSTNNIAVEYAKNGDAGLLWIVAEKQTKGKGRNNCSWESPSGNLSVSLLLVDKFNLENAASLGFVAGISFLEACQRMVSEELFPDFQLKWPNDILLKKKKLGGILLEIIPLTNAFSAVVIGIGANVTKIPEKIMACYPITSLHQNGIIESSSKLFHLLTRRWVRNYALWNRGRGQRKICKEWLRFAAGLGSSIFIQRDGNIFCGIFETIDDKCRLVLRQDNGQLITISAGEIFGKSTVSSVHTLR